MTPPNPDFPGSPPSGGTGQGPNGANRNRLLLYLVLAVVIVGVFILPSLMSKSSARQLTYNTFLNDLQSKQVRTASVNQSSGQITGTLANGASYTVSGPNPVQNSEIEALKPLGNNYSLVTPSSNNLLSILLTWILPFALLIGLMVWMSRRAQGQMGSIMSIGRSKAKLYSTERPSTTFDDVAGYAGVKLEISEVVDFLKTPARFKEIGARIPKGILLVGPPGTGKTLLARAVAGEAGVPFLSVSGSDFMEMFVGVGASRVRDLFQTARKQAPAIVFIDEIDSIGRKRGAGLGGGHDEREQTLNQMLSEMDGFDPTEGIVVMAATNRPDILDPAILRPGRFDRQIVVPLPDLEERLPILQVHCKDKRVAPDVDLEVVARGTPGMSGADLANLVNEAALHAVRRGSKTIENVDFEASRDRVLMGQRRESLVLSNEEKERVAFHEGGHAVLAYVLPHADPVHKVTILPTGMALGVTMQLPMEERHIYPRQQIEDTLAVRMGGRAAELLVYGDLSTGASNDLVGNTELARKMVREWGMSDKIGPMAWGSQGQVFLGDDLMHTRDYSEHTSRVIDDEVELILRAQEERALEVLSRHRGGLDAVARALLDEETIDGETVGRLVDTAYGRPVHESGAKQAPPIFSRANGTASATAGGNGADEGTAAAEGSPDDERAAVTSTASHAAEGAAGQPSPSGTATSQPGADGADAGRPPAPWPPPPPPGGHWAPPQPPWPSHQGTPWPQGQAPWPPPPPPAR
ncbi:MAG: ATP-dependent zinc metalloprotease FtsH [Actinomycetota bacterium]|nr:ATP-dependent zinc metalloprotease FtsH [Actinomycetota bacterium]MDA8293113.1 ATP-dependent zinc metalloprotease FtsH [Actinomycetota bacterium]